MKKSDIFNVHLFTKIRKDNTPTTLMDIRPATEWTEKLEDGIMEPYISAFQDNLLKYGEKTINKFVKDFFNRSGMIWQKFTPYQLIRFIDYIKLTEEEEEILSKINEINEEQWTDELQEILDPYIEKLENYIIDFGEDDINTGVEEFSIGRKTRYQELSPKELVPFLLFIEAQLTGINKENEENTGDYANNNEYSKKNIDKADPDKDNKDEDNEEEDNDEEEENEENDEDEEENEEDEEENEEEEEENEEEEEEIKPRLTWRTPAGKSLSSKEDREEAFTEETTLINKAVISGKIKDLCTTKDSEEKVIAINFYLEQDTTLDDNEPLLMHCFIKNETIYNFVNDSFKEGDYICVTGTLGNDFNDYHKIYLNVNEVSIVVKPLLKKGKCTPASNKKVEFKEGK